MTAYEVMLPTHQMLAAAAGAAAGEGLERPSGDVMRKYVVVAGADGREEVLLFSCGIEHRAAVPAGMRAVSAGFALLYEGGVVVPAIGSESLGLEPAAGDRERVKRLVGR